MELQTRIERRARQRFELELTVQYRLTRKGTSSRWGNGTVCDLSSSGVSFRSRGPLPLGCHLELKIDWPATRGDQYQAHLRATGLVVRSTATRTAMLVTWHQLCVEPAAEMSLSAIA